jgi:hypothetical protein
LNRFASRSPRTSLPSFRLVGRSLLALALVSAFVAACEEPQARGPVAASTPGKAPARIQSFTLAAESLHVDKIGMRDGSFKPDGSLDIVFNARIEGPARALYISAANEKCDPIGVFRLSTSIGDEPAPPELGGALELGRMSGGIAVEENGKFVNAENGAISLSPGPHDLKLYVSNLGTLRDGSVVCVYAIGGDGSVAKSPPLNY